MGLAEVTLAWAVNRYETVLKIFSNIYSPVDENSNLEGAWQLEHTVYMPCSYPYFQWQLVTFSSMAEETIRLLSIKHKEENTRSKYIQVQDPDDSDGAIRSSPADTTPLTAPPSSSNGADTTPCREDDGESGGGEKTMTVMEKFTFVGIAIIYLAASISSSVLAPFFPYQAEKKGVNPTVTGLVFGVFALVSFLASPLWGKYLPVVGAKFMFLSGAFVSAGCNILFGFLDKIGSKTTFLVYCFLIRIVEALGSAATLTSGMAICANVYPDNVAQMNGLLEVFIGLGYAFGPPFGSLFYGIGGYELPFLVLGGSCMALTILNIFFLPSLKISDDEDGSPGSLTEVLRIPAVWMALIACMFGSASLGFTEPALALHVTSPPLSVNPSWIGVLFLFLGGVYVIFTPICGYIADKKRTTRILIVIGNGLTGMALMLLGPSPILHLQGRLWIIILSLLIFGFGAAFLINQTFLDMLLSTSWYGLPDNLSTQSVVSGLFNGIISLGAFIGPIGGGALIEKIGFNWSSTYIAGGNFAIMIMLCLFGAWEFQCGKGRRKPSHVT